MADSIVHSKYDPTAPALAPAGQLDNFPELRVIVLQCACCEVS